MERTVIMYLFKPELIETINAGLTKEWQNRIIKTGNPMRFHVKLDPADDEDDFLDQFEHQCELLNTGCDIYTLEKD